MKFRHSTGSGDDKIELQMTPMIDIVFQLLVFFIMTFRIVAQEGDFNIKMPLAAPSAGIPDDSPLLPLQIQLTSDDSGTLTSIRLQERTFDSFGDLNNYVIGYVGDDTGPGSARETAEAELDCDYNLRYEYVIAAISAVTGYRDQSTGEIYKLIEKVKFAPVESPAAP